MKRAKRVMRRRRNDLLVALSARFDREYAAKQRPGAVEAMQMAFATPPEELARGWRRSERFRLLGESFQGDALRIAAASASASCREALSAERLREIVLAGEAQSDSTLTCALCSTSCR